MRRTLVPVLLFAATMVSGSVHAEPAKKPAVTLTVRVEPGLAVDVVWPGGEKRCAPPKDAPECRFPVPQSARVSLTAASREGNPFDDALRPEFDGACAGQGSGAPYRCELTMFGPRSALVRNGAAGLGKLTVTPSVGGSIASPELQLWCSGGKTCELKITVGLAVRFGRSFRIAARPDAGFKFVSWGGECAQSKSDTCTISATRPRDVTVSATFEPLASSSG